MATVGTSGDVVPFAVLAEGLLAAGHQVTAISWELHRQAFEEAGATFLAAGPVTTQAEIADTAALAATAGSPLDQVAVLRDFHLRYAGDHYLELRDRLAGHDLVLLHGIHTLAEAACRDAAMRYATAVFDPVLLPTASAPPGGMPPLGPLNRLAWWMLDGVLRRQDGPLRAALTAAGSPSAGEVKMFRARSSQLHLVAVSPSIASPPFDLDRATHFTGAWMRGGAAPPLSGDIEAFLAGGDPPVVVTFGSMAAPDRMALADAVVAGTASAGRRLVLQDARREPAAEAAADGVLRIGAVDHRALLGRALAVIHHGGAGTSHAVASVGVPSIVIPHFGDQPFWAARLHRLGVAPPPLPVKKVTAAAVAERIRTAGEPSMRESASALAEAMAAEHGVQEAISLLDAIPG